jgi:hypothetical protein
MIRQPAVAGTFYSASAETLRADVARACVLTETRLPAIAVVSPHAGYIYSGAVAGAVFARITIPETVILLGPNHTGLGPTISVFARGTWIIPGTAIDVDESLSHALLCQIPGAEADTSAHRHEHSLEVQLPFLDHARRTLLPNEEYPPMRVVPIILGTAQRQICRTIGLALAGVIREHAARGNSVPLLLASSDMNHYESDAVTRRKDRQAIEAIQHLDPDGLADAVQEQNISMCGVGPTMAVLHAARALGASAATLTGYATSGEVSKDLEHVVGYAGFVII